MKKCILFLCALLLLAALAGCGGQTSVDTGRVSDVDGRCGNMDGAITATVPATEIPTQEGESNFGTGYTYQIGPDGTIEIPMRLDGAADPQWIVFQKESCK